MKDVLERLSYRYGWDTRSRNVLPAHLVRRELADRRENLPPLLDVGCGYPGLALFLSEVPVIGVDLDTPPARAANVSFQRGSILALPFKDRSFRIVSCIDVLEHLTVEQRKLAVSELVRVAFQAVLVACPHGAIAQSLDHDFRRDIEKHNRPVPDWVNEHLQQPFPEQAAIRELVEQAGDDTGRGVTVSEWYVEPLAVSGLIRVAAARSNWLYLGLNLLFGVMYPLLPKPRAGESYRLVLLAQLSEGE
jgi:SAM-dependent methyltransferase